MISKDPIAETIYRRLIDYDDFIRRAALRFVGMPSWQERQRRREASK